MQFSALPARQGLYDPRHESDSCGVACLADLQNRPSHSLVRTALTALHNMDHRGAAGAEDSSGDGAGITVAVPDAFLRAVTDFELPEPGHYATGIAFLPTEHEARDRVKAIVADTAAAEGLRVLGWRPVPVQADGLGDSARSVMPAFEQLFVAAEKADTAGTTGIALDRLAYGLRKVAERRVADSPNPDDQLYFPSLSARTLTYKGMLTTAQLATFYPDLADERFASRAGPGAQPVLHQHLPVLAAGPAVPADRAQR